MPPNAVKFYIFYSLKCFFLPLYEAFVHQKDLKFTALHATRPAPSRSGFVFSEGLQKVRQDLVG